MIMLAGCAGSPRPDTSNRARDNAATFNQIADDYLAGYLAWRPLEAVQLGFHQYDGKFTDFSRGSIDSELARLKTFDHRLNSLPTGKLTPADFYDFRILRAGIKRQLFALSKCNPSRVTP